MDADRAHVVETGAVLPDDHVHDRSIPPVAAGERWEYRLLSGSSRLEDDLNALGASGWELVAVVPHASGCGQPWEAVNASSAIYCVLKRRQS